MNLRDLHYLTKVAELKHFGKAAQACHVSQPTLSMQLKKLEEYLGVQLFERTNKQVLITAAGEQILTHAQRIMYESEQIKSIARLTSDPLAGDFKLGAFPTLAPYYLPNAVPLIHEKLPNLNLFLVEEKTPHLIAQLKSGKLDAALLALPLEEDWLETVPLYEDPFFLAVHKSHPLAQQDYVSQDALKDEKLLLLEDGHCLRNQALDVCALTGSTERSEFRATSLETLRQMVATNVGITLIPEIAVHQNDNIVYLPFQDPQPSRIIGLAWRSFSARKQCIGEMASFLKK